MSASTEFSALLSQQTASLVNDHVNYDDSNVSYSNSERYITLSDNLRDEVRRTLNYYITTPWNPICYFTTVRGAENIHLYLWIAKDLSWMQSNVTLSMIFGSIASIWCGVLFLVAYTTRSFEDLYMVIPTTLWLLGNFLWMLGEIENDDDAVGGFRAGILFEVR